MAGEGTFGMSMEDTFKMITIVQSIILVKRNPIYMGLLFKLFNDFPFAKKAFTFVKFWIRIILLSIFMCGRRFYAMN